MAYMNYNLEATMTKSGNMLEKQSKINGAILCLNGIIADEGISVNGIMLNDKTEEEKKAIKAAQQMVSERHEKLRKLLNNYRVAINDENEDKAAEIDKQLDEYMSDK